MEEEGTSDVLVYVEREGPMAIWQYRLSSPGIHQGVRLVRYHLFECKGWALFSSCSTYEKAAFEQLEQVMIDNCILVSEATKCDRCLCSDVLLLLPRDVLLAITVPSMSHNLLRDYGSCMMTRIRGAGQSDSASTAPHTPSSARSTTSGTYNLRALTAQIEVSIRVFLAS